MKTMIVVFGVVGVVLSIGTTRASADEAEPLSCIMSRARATCCPGACALKKSDTQWSRANDVLRSCLNSFGCNAGSTNVARECSCS